MTKKPDTYKIQNITEKSKTEFQIAYIVESEDVPYFKALVIGPASKDMKEILQRVSSAAYEQLTNRREKIAKELAEKLEAERTESMWITLKAGIEELKGTSIDLKKPAEKKARLAAPQEKIQSE